MGKEARRKNPVRGSATEGRRNEKDESWRRTGIRTQHACKGVRSRSSTRWSVVGEAREERRKEREGGGGQKERVTREERGEDEVPNKERGEKEVRGLCERGKERETKRKGAGQGGKKTGGWREGKGKREGARGYGQPPSQRKRERSVRRLGEEGREGGVYEVPIGGPSLLSQEKAYLVREAAEWRENDGGAKEQEWRKGRNRGKEGKNTE